MEENVSIGKNGNCIGLVLSSVVVKALQSDKQLKELYSRLNELYSKAIPEVFQVSEHEFKATYLEYSKKAQCFSFGMN